MTLEWGQFRPFGHNLNYLSRSPKDKAIYGRDNFQNLFLHPSSEMGNLNNPECGPPKEHYHGILPNVLQDGYQKVNGHNRYPCHSANMN